MFLYLLVFAMIIDSLNKGICKYRKNTESGYMTGMKIIIFSFIFLNLFDNYQEYPQVAVPVFLFSALMIKYEGNEKDE